MKKIGVVGSGFSGTITTIQLINKLNKPCEIIIFDKKKLFNKGIAYAPYSNSVLLNVIASKMSAFSNTPDHFLDWVMQNPNYKNQGKTAISNSFLPRYLYGEYLQDIWEDAINIAKEKQIKIIHFNNYVNDFDVSKDGITLLLDNQTNLAVNDCIIASGNNIPRNPAIPNFKFYTSENYFQNPWLHNAVKSTSDELPILIIGNGLTMVDTVLCLIEEGFKGTVYSISPNGFNILPHSNNQIKYATLANELNNDLTLYSLVKLVNKHIKLAQKKGIAVDSVIDSLRPHTQKIWRGFNTKEKKMFMSRLRHLWGVARHRIPLQSFDKIQQLKAKNKLHIKAGKIVDINEIDNVMTVEYYDKKERSNKKLIVSRIINCTGPETDINMLSNSFLKTILQKGIIQQDELKLGICTDIETFKVIDAQGNKHLYVYTLGSHLKGELWESTAVNELRTQAEKLATILAEKYN
ncbi:MAG: FAD/NAD(P)-binding protein [Bacteroidia bacterium]|nr:FAD/NAD(P)-binding protein [Bacteroidia bacterium]